MGAGAGEGGQAGGGGGTVFKEDSYGELTFYLRALTLAFPNSDFLAKVVVPECSLSVWLSPRHPSAR